MKAEQGFTLTELLTVIAIGGILAAMAVPSFQDMVANSRITSTTNTLIGQLSLARSEAVKRNQNVVLCRSANATAATPTCDGGGAWEDGWLLFVNVDEDATPDFNPGAGDILLRVQEPLTGSLNLGAAAANDVHIEFATDGLTAMGGATSHFAICDTRGVTDGRQVSIGILGRPELQSDAHGKPISPITSCTNPVAP